MTVFDETYSVATPDGDADDPREADDRIRETKAAVQERENVDHYWPKTGNEVSDADVGEHRQVTGRHQASMGTPDAAKVIIWFKTIDGVTEIMVIDDAGNEKQITTGGKLNISSAELLGILTNDTYFTAINEAGDGTVDLIKGARNEANDADVAQIPDSGRLASNAAPTEDTQIANKKYVDDKTNYTPTAQSGNNDSVGEITFPNGFQMKWGKKTVSGSGVTTVTFTSEGLTAFSNACFNVLSALGNQQGNDWAFQAPTATSFQIDSDSGTATYRWLAIGY